MDVTTVLKRLKPILGEEATKRAWEQLQLADPKTARLLEFSLRRRLAEATSYSFVDNEILLDPIPSDRAIGDIRLGTVMYGRRPFHSFSLQSGELIQHTAIFGRSGAGKTNVAFLMLRELSARGIPFLVFDWKKNYRDLLALKRFSGLVVYTVGRDDAPFFFNPLVPPQGVAPREWLKKLIEVMQHAYFLGEGVAFVLQEVIDQLYREHGVYDGRQQWPTFGDLLNRLRSRPVKGREAAWMESALRAVGVLCFGAMDWVLNSGAHFPVEQLLRQEAVLELDALTNSDKTFLIESLLLWIHHHRMHEPGREQLKHVILVEEAHHVLLKKKQELTGAEAVTDVILREIREFGEAIVLLDQLPSLISRPALENSFTTICLNLKEKGDVTAAAKAMLLESDEARYLGRLPVGSGIVKLQARWPNPFLVRFPLFQIRKGVTTDAQVHARFLESLDVETAASMLNGFVQTMGRHIYHRKEGGTDRKDEQRPLTDEETDLLTDVADHPVSPVTERYQRLSLNPKRGTRTAAVLIDRGFVKAATVSVPGSHVRLLGLTSKARQLLKLPEETDRHGGLEHRYWVERIAAELASDGWQVTKEAPIGHGQAVDLLAGRGDQRIAIEVETGKSDWRANVQKCRRAGVQRVILACTRPSVARSLGRAGAVVGALVAPAATVAGLTGRLARDPRNIAKLS